MTQLRATPAVLLVLAAIVSGQQPPKLPNFDRRTPPVLAVQNVGPSVVNIKTRSLVRTSHLFEGFFMRPPRSDKSLRNRSLGSGVIVHPAGYLVTNEHVINGAVEITASLRDGRTLDATVVNTNFESDLALLKLEGKGPFPYVALGEGDDLLVGETVIALGNPFGLVNSVTTGVLSAVGREVAFRNRKVFEDFIQTSALINPGNSGGPLLDINGRVIGINVAIDTRGQGIGYAIPVGRVKRVMTALANPELVKHAWLGLEVQSLPQGLVVSRVYEEGPARSSGVRRGDVIRAVAHERVASEFDFFVKVLEHDNNQKVLMTLARDRRKIEVAVLFEPYSIASRDAGMVCTDLTPVLSRRFGLRPDTRAVAVTEIRSGGPADRVGIRVGDVILEVGGYRISDSRSLDRVLAYATRRESSTRIVIFRDGSKWAGTMAF